MIFGSKPTAAQRRAFKALGDGLEAISKTLPEGTRFSFERSDQEVSLEIQPPTRAHRRLFISAFPAAFEYELGALWSEPAPLTEAGVPELLAACQAVIVGGVREVRDARTGIRYHIYRLRSHGLHKFARDSEYHLLHWLKLKVRKVKIRRLPPLSLA